MAHWQRNEKEMARDWLKPPITWMDMHAPVDAELIEFRREAETLIVADM